MMHSGRFLVAWAVSFLALLTGSCATQAAAQSGLLFVESYSRLLEKKKIVLGTDYRIEGRISSISPRLLKLQKCPQVFRPAEGTTFGKAPHNRRVVELYGRLETREEKRIFVVSILHFRRDDEQRFLFKRTAVRRSQAKDWYDLARWANRRANYYNDRTLRQRAIEANRSGLEAERRRLDRIDSAALLKLAEQAGKLKLPDAVALEYVHEAHRLTWERERKQKEPNFETLLDDIVTRLAGAKVRLPTPQPELEKRYRRSPVTVYRAADEKTRRKLHRLFYRDVRLASILQQRSAGSDGFQAAELIERDLPELHARAAEERERELERRSSRVETLTRGEMLDLADRLRRRKQPEKASASLKKWLKVIEEQSRKAGPDGLVRMAEEYIDLLEDREKAADLLKEAYRLSPESERISEKLTVLDFRLHDGRWIPARQLEAQPLGPIEKAIRAGRVVAGMTAAEVESTLGAATSVTRVATSGQVSELWIYGNTSATRLVVLLLRRTPRAPLKAVRVSQVSAR